MLTLGCSVLFALPFCIERMHGPVVPRHMLSSQKAVFRGRTTATIHLQKGTLSRPASSPLSAFEEGRRFHQFPRPIESSLVISLPEIAVHIASIASKSQYAGHLDILTILTHLLRSVSSASKGASGAARRGAARSTQRPVAYTR